VQSIYGLWIKPGDKKPITKPQLQGLGLAETNQNNVVTRTLTGTAGFSWQTKRGWYVDLALNNQSQFGERVIADPVIERGLLTMTSFLPNAIIDRARAAAPPSMQSDGRHVVDYRRDGDWVVSSILPLINEAPILGQRSTTLAKTEAEAALRPRTCSAGTTELIRRQTGSSSA
jgi:hypothetical protein